jgi:hypothetical protein
MKIQVVFMMSQPGDCDSKLSEMFIELYHIVIFSMMYSCLLHMQNIILSLHMYLLLLQ